MNDFKNILKYNAIKQGLHMLTTNTSMAMG
jgi:hypothetical protein